jgi:hypothetical protein
MNKGNKVKFVGDFSGYTIAGQTILRRTGEVIQSESTIGWSLAPGTVRVRWIPKTRRGWPETFTHKINELEIV